MKRLMLAAMLVGPCFAVAAQNPGTADAKEPAAAARAESTQLALPAERPLDDYRCLRHTGSLVTASRNRREALRPGVATHKPRCAPVAGRAWSREDLDRTGANNVLDALRMLDPSVH